MKLLDKDGLTYYTGKIKNELTDYVKNTDYATSSKGGVIKLNAGSYATSIDNGALKGITKDYVQAYPYMSTDGFITKGTLENVITGKALETANNKVISISSSSTDTQYPSAKATYTYINTILGDIETLLSNI